MIVHVGNVEGIGDATVDGVAGIVAAGATNVVVVLGCIETVAGVDAKIVMLVGGEDAVDGEIIKSVAERDETCVLPLHEASKAQNKRMTLSSRAACLSNFDSFLREFPYEAEPFEKCR